MRPHSPAPSSICSLLFSIILGFSTALSAFADGRESPPREPGAGLSEECPRDFFQWLEGPTPWPVEPVVLGGVPYTRTDLQALYANQDDEIQDVSLLLAARVVAAELNRAFGVPWSPVDDLLAQAQALLTSGVSLPYAAGNDTLISLQIAASLAPYNTGELTPNCPRLVPTGPPPSCPMTVREWSKTDSWPIESLTVAGATVDRGVLDELLSKPGSVSKEPVRLLTLEVVAAELNAASAISWAPLEELLGDARAQLEGVAGAAVDPCSERGVELAVRAAKLQRFNGRATLESCLPEGRKLADLDGVEARLRGSRCHDFWGFAELHTHMFAEFGWNERFIEGTIDDFTLGTPQPQEDALHRCSGALDHASLGSDLLVTSELLTLTPGVGSLPASLGDSGFHFLRRNGFDTRQCLFACTGPGTCLTRTTQAACLAADPGLCRDDVPNNVSFAGTVACNTNLDRAACQGAGYCGSRNSSFWSIVDDLQPCWAQWPNCDAGDRCLKRDPTRSLTCGDLDETECQNHPNECDWRVSCRHQSGSLTCNDLTQADCGQYGQWCDWKPDRCIKDPLNPLPFECNDLSQNDCGKYSECTWAGFLGCRNNLSGSLTCSDLDPGDCGQYGFWCDWKTAECKKDPLVFSPFECNDLDLNDCQTYSECRVDERCVHPLLAPPLECSDLSVAECANHGDSGCGVRDCVTAACEWQDWGECRWEAVFPLNCGEHYQDWPTWDTPTHQQHWWGHLEDAWRRGLRVVSASILEVDPLAVMMEDPDLRTPFEVIFDQLQAANDFAARHPWVEIALDAQQAHDIAERGDLALVLTLEGNFPFCTVRPCGQGADEEVMENIEETLDTYMALGLRGMQVVSHFDNPYAGVAIYNPSIHALQWLYEEINADGVITEAEMGQALNQPMVTAFANATNVVQATMPLLPVPNLSDLFPVTGFDDLNDFHAALASQGGASGVECVHRDTFQPMDCSTCLRDREPCRNVVGLTPLGEELVRAMVDRRLLIDIAHLSEVGVLDVWRVVQDQSPTDTYPLYVSHGDARDALADNGGNKGQHQEKPTPQWVFDIIRQSGGMFGLRTGPDQFATQATSLVDNDCAGSSKSFAQSLEHALQTADVETGFAVDMNGMIANSAPRFVDNQSWKMRRRGERAACLGSDWQQSLQNRGVVDDPTTPFTDESRFNHHGLGHIGMLGALIDDLENSGLPVDVIGAIFSSAEAFVEMWENVP